MAVFTQYRADGGTTGTNSVALPSIPVGKRLKLMSVAVGSSVSSGDPRTFALELNNNRITPYRLAPGGGNYIVFQLLNEPIILPRASGETFNLQIRRRSNNGTMYYAVYGIIEDNV